MTKNDPQSQTLTAYDRQGTAYPLSSTNSRGGEGTLYLLKNDPSRCAKIFKPNCRTRGKYIKITALIALNERGAIKASFADQVIIPRRCLYSDPAHQEMDTFIGYTMERLKGFHSPSAFGRASNPDYMEKVTAAKNIAILTHVIHSCGFIIGDFNENNIAVFRGAKTRLLDADSIQFTVRKGGQIIFLPCNGLYEEYRPPELQEVDLSGPQSPEHPLLTVYSDYWQMAIHIFRLLMNGASPFASASLHPEANDPEEKRQTFVYSEHTDGLIPPPYAPDYNMLSNELQGLFEQCFVSGRFSPEKRPGPQAYYSALCNYARILARRACGHMMPAGRSSCCEWCRLKKEGFTYELNG